MPVTIEQLRVRIGLADNDATRDAEITEAMTAAFALMENYCDRKFDYAADKETETHFDGVTVSLRRYPIDHVISVKDYLLNDVARYHVDEKRGLVMFDDYRVTRHKLYIEYEGGYKPDEFPEDLIQAFYPIFDQLMATGGGGGGLAAGAIQSVTLADVGTVRYATGAAAEAAASGQGFLPASSAMLLDAYVRKFA